MIMGKKTPFNAQKMLIAFHSMKQEKNQTIEYLGPSSYLNLKL